jgi:hemerythrin-like domain-containing protein
MPKMAKRDHSLVPLSREHHYGLLFVLKVRRGLAVDFAAFFELDLRPHFRAEEEALFPALAASTRWAALVSDLIADHRLLGRIAEQIRAARPEEQRRLLAQFADLLEEHIRREERELFPLYEELADESLKRTVAERLKLGSGNLQFTRTGN